MSPATTAINRQQLFEIDRRHRRAVDRLRNLSGRCRQHAAGIRLRRMKIELLLARGAK